MAPKSNAVFTEKDVKKTANDPVPLQLRNARKILGYGTGYELAHNAKDKLTTMKTMPPSVAGNEYYIPTEEGDLPDWHQRHPGKKQGNL